MDLLIVISIFITTIGGFGFVVSAVKKSNARKTLREAEDFNGIDSIRQRLAPFGINVVPDTTGFPRLADVGSICLKKNVDIDRPLPPCGYCPGERPKYELWELVAERHGHERSPHLACWQTKCWVCIHCGSVSREQGPFPGSGAFSDLLGVGDNLNDLLDPFEGIKFDIGGRVRALMEAQRQTFLKRLEDGETVLRERERLLTAKPGS